MEELLKSEEAEQYVIAGILANNNNYDKVASFLTEEHFYYSTYATIYKTAGELINKNIKADNITVSNIIPDEIIRKSLIQNLFIQGIGTTNVEDYARIIFDRWQKREIMSTLEYCHNQLKTDLSFEVLDFIGDSIDRVNNVSTDAVSVNVLTEIENRVKNKGKLTGKSTGITNLDEAIDGIQTKNLYILGGRSGMGKSGLASCLTANMLIKDIKVGIISLEMTINQFKKRILSSITGVDTVKMDNGYIDMTEFEKLKEAETRINGLYITDKSGVNINYIRSVIRAWKRKGCNIIMIDHLGLIKHPQIRNVNYSRMVGETTSALKVLAKELDVAIILLVQVNRDTEKRANPRPALSDLKDSGSIEEDADVVMFIYSSMPYLERDRPDSNSTNFIEWQDKYTRALNKGEIIVAKNRHGQSKIIDIYMNMQQMKFADLTTEGEF